MCLRDLRQLDPLDALVLEQLANNTDAIPADATRTSREGWRRCLRRLAMKRFCLLSVCTNWDACCSQLASATQRFVASDHASIVAGSRPSNDTSIELLTVT